ncbi:MAG: hypothetical protein WBC91_20300 [Phototrophicaceae bacterium]
MAKVIFDFDIDGALQADPYLDQYTVNYLFEQTKQSIGKGLARKLDGITCDEHGTEPTITITGRYSGSAEQMDIDYHIDTCCQLFMVRVVKMLNNVN